MDSPGPFLAYHQLTGAQCPSCFSFNFPEIMAQISGAAYLAGNTIRCALCKTEYPLTQNDSFSEAA